MPSDKTNEIPRLHREAMELATTAMLSSTGADSLRKKALALEKKAAFATPLDMEPTRSVLFRSAASLALQLNELRAAEMLAAQGLSGQPPAEVCDELRSLLQKIWASMCDCENLGRHLQDVANSDLENMC